MEESAGMSIFSYLSALIAVADAEAETTAAAAAAGAAIVGTGLFSLDLPTSLS